MIDETRSKIIYLNHIGEVEWPFPSMKCVRISSMSLAQNNLRCLFAQKETFQLLIFFNNFLSRFLMNFNYLFCSENEAQILEYLVGQNIRSNFLIVFCFALMIFDSILTRGIIKSVSFLIFNSPLQTKSFQELLNYQKVSEIYLNKRLRKHLKL